MFRGFTRFKARKATVPCDKENGGRDVRRESHTPEIFVFEKDICSLRVKVCAESNSLCSGGCLLLSQMILTKISL